MEPEGSTIRVTVRTMTRAVATLALSVTLVGSPVASLYCDNSTPAAMACCRNKAPECNQPGTSDDCCRTPVEKDVFAGSSPQLTGKPQWTSVISFDALVPSAPSAVALASSLRPRFSHRTSWADLAPPPLSILRV